MLLFLLKQITSGKEKKLFDIKSKKDGSGGEIYSKINLDYENPQHRKGFNFHVEVTDAVSSLSIHVTQRSL